MLGYKSKQTGWVHFNPHSTDGLHDTIPVVENACHILELLQTKSSQQLYEAKFLLERMSAFQAPSGNFPHYLHEYPHTYNSLTAFELLTPFHLIQKHFGSILKSFKPTIERLHSFCDTVIDRVFITPAHKTLLKAAKGMSIHPDEWRGESSSTWGLLLQAYRIAPDPICLQNLSKHIHPTLNCFVGLYEPQEEKRQARSLLDLFLGNDVGDHPIALRASIVEPVSIKGFAPDCVFHTSYTPTEVDKFYHLMHHYHANCDLVCQAKHFSMRTQDGKIMEFTYPDRDEELCFYVSHTQPVTVDNTGASAFALNQTVRVGPFSFRFESIGEGTFMGHISRANRPAQIAAKGAKRFKSYDWRIALRCVQKQGPANIRAICKNEYNY